MGQLSSVSSRREFRLHRDKMLAFLDELEGADGEARTLYLPPGAEGLEQLFPGETAPEGLGELVSASANGAVLFWGTARRCLVVPPFPLSHRLFASGYEVGLLRTLLEANTGIALVLVRLGSYAIGIARGGRLICAKSGTGLVHARHRQGGSSQHRFERHRDKQIEYFLTRVCGHIREQFEPHAGGIDYLLYGGARTTVLLLRKRCPFLERFEDRLLPPLLTIPEPRSDTLRDAVEQAWSSRVFEWRGIT